MDARGNAVFPHFDAEGLCGYEITNKGFTGFAAGASKGLWFSQAKPEDNRLVFCESAIDALSHAALYPAQDTRYASIGDQVNPQQPELIRAAVAVLGRAGKEGTGTGGTPIQGRSSFLTALRLTRTRFWTKSTIDPLS